MADAIHGNVRAPAPSSSAGAAIEGANQLRVKGHAFGPGRVLKKSDVHAAAAIAAHTHTSHRGMPPVHARLQARICRCALQLAVVLRTSSSTRAERRSCCGWRGALRCRVQWRSASACLTRRSERTRLRRACCSRGARSGSRKLLCNIFLQQQAQHDRLHS